MAKALSPAFLRLGGTAADLLYFKKQPFEDKLDRNSRVNSIKTPDGNCACENLENGLYKNRTAFPMSAQDWIDINEFSKTVGWSFLFDVNVLIRNGKNRWR